MIADNYQIILNEIAKAAKKSGRDPKEITLIAVVKHIDWQTTKILYDQGQRIFGENRLSDAFEKQRQAPEDCQWHFIGSLQSNKVRKIVGKFALIHSIDSLSLAKKLSTVSQESKILTPILLQANTSSEKSKQGLAAEEWKREFGQILNLPGISVRGLMTMAPLVADEKMIRTCFAGLRILRDELQRMAGDQANLHHLSMGMSNDFKWAIQEGATMVRIGTALVSQPYTI